MLICVTFSLPPGVRGWLRLLLVALPGLFCSPFNPLGGGGGGLIMTLTHTEDDATKEVLETTPLHLPSIHPTAMGCTTLRKSTETES